MTWPASCTITATLHNGEGGATIETASATVYPASSVSTVPITQVDLAPDHTIPAGKPNLHATIADLGLADLVYTWTVTNGVISGGQGTRDLVYSAGPAGADMKVEVSISGGVLLEALHSETELVHLLPYNFSKMITTASLSGNGGQEAGYIDLGKSIEITSLAMTCVGRFRLYNNAAGRDADLTRGQGIKVPKSYGLVAEMNANASTLTTAFNPHADGTALEVSNPRRFYYTIDNLSGVSQSIQVTIAYTQES